MTTPLWCLLIVSVFPFVLAGIGGYLRTQQLGSLDTHHPRVQALELRDAAARAYAAQANAWEAVTIFGVAVVIAHLAGADAEKAALASIVYVVVRVLHAAAYIADFALVRTGVFTIGLGCCVRLFALAIVA
jgi:uncharacterized MAPEG superfamily protein